MRKAFDSNVSRAKPRLRLGAFTSTAVVDEAEAGTEASAPDEQQGPVAGQPVYAQAPVVTHQKAAPAPSAPVQTAEVAVAVPATAPSAQRAPVHVELPANLQTSHIESMARSIAEEEVTFTAPPPPTRASTAVTVKEKLAEKAQAVAEIPAPQLDPKARRERLKERLKAATARVAPAQPTPQTAGEARTSALALVAQLKQELEDANKLNAALTKDLEFARTELSRAATEARSRTEEANRMAAEVAERVKLIEELGREMSSVEAERDDTLVELRTARGAAEELLVARREIEEKLAAREAELSDALTEEERIASELELRNEDLRRAESTLAAITAERDALAKQVAELTAERAQLVESQKALDEIHRALAEARARVGR